MVSFIMLSVNILSVKASFIMLSFNMLSVVILSIKAGVILFNVMMRGVKMSVIICSVAEGDSADGCYMLNVIELSVMFLNVMAPKILL